MRIGVDVRYLSHGLVGGVHTYLQHVIPALIELAHEHQVILYADTKSPFELRDLPEHVTVRYLPWRSALWSLYHDQTLKRTMAADCLDVAHFPANYGFGPRGSRTVLTLHDAINLLPWTEIVRGHQKSLRTIAMMTYLHYQTRAAVRGADVILTDSAHAAQQIGQLARIDQRKVIPLPLAHTPDHRPIREPAVLDAVRRRHGLARPFILADALKNPGVLVHAWQQLPREVTGGREILFFSRRPDPPTIVRQAVETGSARLLIRPPREDLIAFYSMAEAFVFPSWIEGFGIPILEAMACGAPVIASDRGAIPEVAGGAALLSDAEDATALARHLLTVLNDPDVAAELRERGLRRAADFSWSKTAQGILDCYEATLCDH